MWGFACFLPVGMAYLSALILLLAISLHRGSSQIVANSRWQLIHGHLVFWPVCAFLLWSLLILIIKPYYAETPSNLFHILRIALTVAIVLSLRRNEALAGIWGWITGALAALLIVYVNILFPIPHILGLSDLLAMKGNKSIGIAVMLAIFACCTLIYATSRSIGRVYRWGVLGMAAVIPVLIWLLPSRTSLLLIMISLSFGLVHRLRKKPSVLFLAAMALFIFGWSAYQVPAIQKRFSAGVQEIQQSMETSAPAGDDLSQSSWGMRHLLYTKTTDMVLERPLMGWGIGSWNDEWKKRTPASVHAANMPHNDFLWMGAQAGLPGSVSLLAIIVALFWSVLRLQSPAATASFVASAGLLVAMTFNSALRDAQIGMSVLFVVLVLNVYALRYAEDLSQD
jgi:O-antigen ligase